MREPQRSGNERHGAGEVAARAPGVPGRSPRTAGLAGRGAAPVQMRQAAPGTSPAGPASGTDWTRVAVRPDLFDEPDTGGRAEVRGGTTYRIRRGDTLWAIAEATYGHGRHWRRIRDVNPGKVFRDGNLILVGDELALPEVEVAAGSSTDESAATDAPVTDRPAGDSGTNAAAAPEACEPAVEPVEVCTDYGDFIIYPDDYDGPLPPASVETSGAEAGGAGTGSGEAASDGPRAEHLHESDYLRVLAEREAEAVAQRETTVDEVDDLLSRGVFDWAVTDGDARQSLEKLAGLPMAQLRVAVGQIDGDRLLDNLPSSARKTEAFAKVIVAMGPDRYRGFIRELLSYGLFDWAITDGNVETVSEILAVLSADEQAEFLRSLEPIHVSRYARNMPRGGASNEQLATLFQALPDSDLDALESVMEARFNLDMSSWFLPRLLLGVGENWDADGLRRLWVMFEQLPPDHLENNEKLDLFLRESTDDGSGFYQEGLRAGVVSYSDVTERGSYGRIMVPDGAGGTQDVGLHSDVNLFSTVVRHEVGHAVDADIGASAEGGYARTAASAGQWQTYSSAGAFVDAIISAGGGMGGHGYADEEAYERAMRKAVSDEKDFTQALADVDDSVAAPGAGVTGPVTAVLDKTRWHADESPWYRNADRQDVGGRMWQRPYGSGEYASFVKSARVDHGVSAYQFRAPGEWFAEAYAAYYSDHDGRAGNPVGTNLRTRDTATADWFDAQVDKGYSLRDRTGGGAGGGAGGAGGSAGGPGGSASGTRSAGGGAGGAGG